MIRVDRPPEPADVGSTLRKPFPKDNKTELDRARAYYAKKRRRVKAYAEFKRYKEDVVRQALRRIFHDKCAYCESHYAAVVTDDIEHYRPKGGVAESPSHPGYWWIAASWSNLLPCCPDCNRPARRVVYDQKLTLEQNIAASRQDSGTLSGKANAFPVRRENWVTKEGVALSREDPLLINPCEHTPQDHFDYTFEWDRQHHYIWDADVVVPVLQPRLEGGCEDVYAKASIAIYGLWRVGLVREHITHVRILQRLCLPVVRTIARVAKPGTGPLDRQALKEELATYKASLMSLTKSDQVYAAMTRAFVKQLRAELDRFRRRGNLAALRSG